MAQALGDPDHRADFSPPWQADVLARVHRAGDLVQIPTDRSQLKDGFLERQELGLRDRRRVSQVRSMKKAA